MKCLHCGHCCKTSFVVIVIDPDKGITSDNLKALDLNKEPCPHLQGNKPGKYSCAIHNKEWYLETPCFKHTQIEAKDSPCRLGKYVLDKQRNRRNYESKINI